MGCLCPPAVKGVPITLSEQEPEPDERKAFDEVKEVLDEKKQVRESIEQYKGCQELARAAMSKPSDETEMAAFEGLLLAVDSICQFFNFAKDLERVFPTLLKKLATGVEDQVCQLHLFPGLTYQLGTIFNFALDFDRVRMLRPNLSNDFSYYRRLLPKFNKHQGIKVKDDEASGMAMFTAEHIPMTQSLARAGAKAQELLIIKDGRGTEGLIGFVLATMANSCMLSLTKDTNHKCDLHMARAMTGAVIIFDHVDRQGAFARRSPIAIKGIIKILKSDFAQELSLLNALRYSTKTFRDAPDNIQALFE